MRIPPSRPFLFPIAVAACILFSPIHSEADPIEDPDSLFASANLDFEAGEYAAAIEKYLLLARSGLASSDLFFNLGAAKYRLGETGEAVLWMRRALVVEPSMPEVRQSLTFLRARFAFFEFTEGRLARILGSLPPALPRWTWSIAFWMALIAASLALGMPRFRIYRSSLATLAIVLTLTGIVAFRIGRYREKNIAVENFATVTRAEAKALTAPTPDAKAIIDLPQGSEVRIIRDSGPWRYAEIPGELRGWVRADSVAPVWPVTFPESHEEPLSPDPSLPPAANTLPADPSGPS